MIHFLICNFQGLPEEMKSRKKFKKADGTSKSSGNGDASLAYEEKEKIEQSFGEI